MNLFTVSTVYLLSCVYFLNAFYFSGFRNHIIQLENVNSTIRLIKVENRVIEQPVDHFNNSDQRTFQMRYFEGLELWKPGGPIYLFISGNQPANFTDIQQGQIHLLAEETGGALYLSEHRYYGESLPFRVMSTKNLAYASSRQALADIAKLLKHLKSLPQYKTSKVVVVGAGYAGNLAAWMRLLYSDLVDAAIASSAPVLAKLNFNEFYESIGESYREYGTPGCYDNISALYNGLDQHFKTIEGTWQLKKRCGVCINNDFDEPYNRQTFFYLYMHYFTKIQDIGSPQYIKEDCKNIFGNVHSEIFYPRNVVGDHHIHHGWCFVYDYRITMQVNLDKPWFYQVCREFANFPTTFYSDKHPFAKVIHLEFWFEMCAYTYRINKTTVIEGVRKTNDMYGGLKPNVSHVVFVNGDIDPWHKLGVLEDISEDSPAKLIHGTARGQDLYADSPQDPDELIQTRKYVRQLIKKWIGAGEYADK